MNLVSRSRYRRLLQEALKEGTRTKVLMLSATPVCVICATRST